MTEMYEDDIKLNITELENYFNKRVETSKMNYTFDEPIKVTHTYYYLNTPTSFDILLNESKIRIDKDVSKIVIRREELHKFNSYATFIFFEDKNDVDYDVDIETNSTDDNIFFIFDSDYLKDAYSLDYERNSIINLINDLSIYNPKEENKKILNKWIRDNEDILTN